MTNTELYAIAKKHIGEGGAKARAYCGMSGGAWCNAYVCYIANEGGVRDLYFDGTKQTYCPKSIKWCEANLAMIPPYLAMPMDIIYFDWQPNRIPDHIGFVKEPISPDKIATHEGNTNGGVVAEKTRTANYIIGIFRPHFKPKTLPTGTECKVDGVFGYDSIYFLQKALGLKASGVLGKVTVKALQKKAGATADGAWGKTTSKKVQKMIGTTVDGAFGKESVKALQKWINKQNNVTTTTETTTEVETSERTISNCVASMKAFAKKYADDNSYGYKKWTSDPKTHQCPLCHKGSGKGWNCIGYVSAICFHGGKIKTVKCSCDGIGNDAFFQNVTLEKWKKRNGKNWSMITNGGKKIPSSMLKAGDILLFYDKNGKWKHIGFYYGNGKFADSTSGKTQISIRPYSSTTLRCTKAFRPLYKL